MYNIHKYIKNVNHCCAGLFGDGRILVAVMLHLASYTRHSLSSSPSQCVNIPHLEEQGMSAQEAILRCVT